MYNGWKASLWTELWVGKGSSWNPSAGSSERAQVSVGKQGPCSGVKGMEKTHLSSEMWEREREQMYQGSCNSLWPCCSLPTDSVAAACPAWCFWLCSPRSAWTQPGSSSLAHTAGPWLDAPTPPDCSPPLAQQLLPSVLAEQTLSLASFLPSLASCAPERNLHHWKQQQQQAAAWIESCCYLHWHDVDCPL